MQSNRPDSAAKSLRQGMIALLAVGTLSTALPALATSDSQKPMAEARHTEHTSSDKHHKHHKMKHVHQQVTAYQLQHGDITQAEVDRQQAERKTLHMKMKQLKASGDQRENFKARAKTKREAMKAYISAHPELQAQLKSERQAMRDKHAKGEGKSARREKMQRIHKLVADYQLQQGHITQAELDQQQSEREALRAQMQQLKASGDKAAIKAKRKELKAAFKAKHQVTRAYIEEHPELQEQLKAERMAKRGDDRDA